jgi:hypothetical protein
MVRLFVACITAGLNRDMLTLPLQPRDGLLRNGRAVGNAAQMTRTDLMMDRRTAMKSAVLAGAALLSPVEGSLWAFEQSASRTPARFAPERHHDIENLEEAARTFRELRGGRPAERTGSRLSYC